MGGPEVPQSEKERRGRRSRRKRGSRSEGATLHALHPLAGAVHGSGLKHPGMKERTVTSVRALAEEEVGVVQVEWEGAVLLETRSHGQRRSCPLLHEEVDPCARDRRGRDLSEEPDLLGRLLVEGRPWAVPPVRRRSVLVAHRGEGSSGTCETLRRKGGGVPRKQRRPHALSHVGGRRLDPAVVWRTISA